MITDHEWDVIAKRVFSTRAAKAPPFLWTRVLASIEELEARRANAWWMQWRWMGRMTMAVAVGASLGALYIFNQASLPLEAALAGRPTQRTAIQMARADAGPADDDADLVVGLDS